ncbi:hypothetical protein AAIB48_10090 [Paraclostridium benzoelyticum]|uniref:hypothetical protein n=1 Tax=Paraclostridium benzoelyticum TaxID=1629550 RepID=UPI0031CDA567
MENSPYIGINGQIAKIENKKVYVVVGNKLLCLTELETENNQKIDFRVGKKLTNY